MEVVAQVIASLVCSNPLLSPRSARMTPLDILRAHEPGRRTRPEDCASRTPLPIDEGDRVGVVLFNMGGPATLDDVEPFLYRLLMDPLFLDVPVGGRMRHWLATSIAYARAESLRERYELIGGGSPVPRLAHEQAEVLQGQLQARYGEPAGVEFRTYPAMRYGTPFPEEAAAAMAADGIDKVVLLPLYPQFSWTTSGSSFRDWETVAQQKFGNERPWEEYVVKNYHLNERYLASINSRIDETLQHLDEDTINKTHLIFSAHGTPILEVKSGDPYTREIEETMEAVMERRGRNTSYWIGYQSKVGPQKWTQPNTAELVERHMNYGISNFLMIPIAFVTDHIETLYELGVELKEDLEEEGYHPSSLEVMKGINDHPMVIDALGEEVLKRLSRLGPEVID